MKVLQVDQWSSTGNFSGLTLEDFEKDPTGSLQKVKGGDAEAARSIFGGTARVKEVNEYSGPTIGEVWLREVDGKLEVWKTNYDSSD